MKLQDLTDKIPKQYKNYELAVEINDKIKDIEYLKIKLSKNKIVIVTKEEK